MAEPNQSDFRVTIHDQDTQFTFHPDGIIISSIALSEQRRRNAIDNLNDVLGLMNHFYTDIEETIMEQVLEESLTHYKTSERKPDVRLKINKEKYKDVKRQDEKHCTICMDDYNDDSNVSILKCSHIFHSKCISEWGMYKAECPVCRDNIIVKDPI